MVLRSSYFSRACWLALAVLLVGCSVGRANRRVEYWEVQTRSHVPKGIRIKDARTFFASQGLDLGCCMSGPDIKGAYSAMDRNVGRFAFMEYSLLIVVDVDQEHLVERVRVLRIGVGL